MPIKFSAYVYMHLTCGLLALLFLKGTDKISIMIQDTSSQNMKVNWNGEAFKNMKNLKVLIFEKAWFSEGPKYLPNSLRILKWPEYPSSSLPLDFHPKKLLLLELPHSCLYSVEPIQARITLYILCVFL